jgi:DNA-binding response OmpR family regulator
MLAAPDRAEPEDGAGGMIPHASHAPGKTRILIVDDVEDNRIVLQRQLQRSGFETTLCEDGIAALAEVSANPPDLVILDWMMPNLSGLDTLKAIREHFDGNRLPVIMCTARDEESSIGVAMDAGANDYVQKPIRMPVLLARISSQLIRKAAVEALGVINTDLEETLAQRTRLLFEQRSAEQKQNP